MTADQDDNPYQPPRMSEAAAPPGASVTYQPPGPLLIFVVVVAAIIASVITFFCSCVGLLMVTESRGRQYFGPDWVLPACGMIGLLAFALTVRMGLRIFRGPRIASASGDQAGGRVRSVGTWGGIVLASFLVGMTGFALLAGIGPRFGFLTGIVVAAAVGTLVIWLSQKRWASPEPEPPLPMESFAGNNNAAEESNESQP